MSLLEEVKGISQAPHNRFTIIMGKPGSGKTTLAGTYPKPILFVTIGNDGGSEVLKNYQDKDIEILEINNDPLTKVGGKHIQAKLLDLLNELSVPHKYKTIVIDPYSSIEESLVKRMETIKGAKLSMPEHGAVGKAMLDLRDKIIELSHEDVEYVLVSHIKVDEGNIDAATGEINPQIILKLTKNNGRSLLEKASNVAYCCKRTVLENDKMVVKFLTYLGAHPNMDTKIRLKKDDLKEVGIYVSDCSYDTIESLRQGSKKPEEIKTEKVVETAKNPFEEDEIKENDNE